ncbi:MAG: ThiF family adenylyltransferase [Verrucomicrobia bacterium]|nr:ThiF family adenylyltransferase [Verrucomicrobiota bacterium]
MPTRHQNRKTGRSITVIGAGGNIGSHLVPHLARMANLTRVTLIDMDSYQSKNLSSQDVTQGSIGKPKALVQASRLKAINPALRCEGIVADVRDVPLGKIRADVILACLDSKDARRVVNQIAWRLGVPWIDAGVQADGLLVRVNVYVPGSAAPCLECSWSDADYATARRRHPCQAAPAKPAPTDAPSYLGALAASLQAVECHKLLTGQTAKALVGRQVLMDAAFHKHYVTSFQRNPGCRFDHVTHRIEPLRCKPFVMTLRKALDGFSRDTRKGGEAVLSVEGKTFVFALACPGCGREKPLFGLTGRLRATDSVCPNCRRVMLAAGLNARARVSQSQLSDRLLDRSLASIGFRAGDVLTVLRNGRERQFEIGR